MRVRSCFVVLSMTVMTMTAATGLSRDVNYDENKVPAYALPDPLVCQDGTRVVDADTWRSKRRPEILGLFESHMYGRMPGPPERCSVEVLSQDDKALGGKARRREVRCHFKNGPQQAHMDLLIYLPPGVDTAVPVFVGLNFFGNHTIHSDPEIALNTEWMQANKALGIENNRATEASRGVRSSRWPVELILSRGYGLATVYCGDLDPDFHDGFKNGVHPLFAPKGVAVRPDDAWGTICAWAWGLSRAMDYFETDSAIDAKRVAVLGHSRLGKTALWAGACDERFSVVISNDSGCGGAALSRRRIGERIDHITKSFPHWFCGKFTSYCNRENELPMDQHMLIALMAPRPCYVASAVEDKWADPNGEFLSAKHAESVYRLFGKEGIPVDTMPAADTPAHGTLAYHIRSGKHDLSLYDWERYLDFADRHLGGKNGQ